ncbi:Rab-like protein 3 [Blomia tropicalis]|nr:Rab-like protein 3 [Blomia tropicalis]
MIHCNCKQDIRSFHICQQENQESSILYTCFKDTGIVVQCLHFARRVIIMANMHEKIKVLVLGDSGVGKSSLVHLICHLETIVSTQWTIGCSIDIKLHQYKEGTVQQRTCYIELWDVGGSRSHSIARKIFYQSPHGIILVQDQTNRKSEANLKNWLGQALSDDGNGRGEKDHPLHRSTSNINAATISQALFPVAEDDFDYDDEFFAGLSIPILIVATKQDLVGDSSVNCDQSTNELVKLLKCEMINVNCRNSKSLAPGTTNAVKLSRFFDKVCDKRFHTQSILSPSSSSYIQSSANEKTNLMQRSIPMGFINNPIIHQQQGIPFNSKFR